MSIQRIVKITSLMLIVAILSTGCMTKVQIPKGGPIADWPYYGKDPGGSRYSPLTQITPDNVKQLKVAWEYRTGEISSDTRFEATPIMVDGALYLDTLFNKIIALDPETGTERWTYDPKVNRSIPVGDPASRGVSTWLDTKRSPGEACHRRIFVATRDARLIALDAASGIPCSDFGKDGQVDLTLGVGISPLFPGEYHMTSPPAVIGRLVIVGSSIDDNIRVDAPKGIVRAFDTRTGEMRWSWDPIPRNSTDPAWKTWNGRNASRTGAANVWSIISVDPDRNLVFLPTTNPSPDFYGGERLGSNIYADSVVALNASTGKVVWHFQVVHHDIWDYDVPAQPTLVTVRRDGKDIPAVAVGTKMGHLFLLNRETGDPLFPVEERSVPKSIVPGEEAWPTQPFPISSLRLVPEKLTPDDAWGLTPWDRGKCREQIEKLRFEGIFTPPSLEGTLIFPGDAGGILWGGVAFEPKRDVLLVNTNRVAFGVTLIPRKDYAAIKAANPDSEISPMFGTPYGMKRDILLSPLKLPCNPPPWGTLAAVNLTNGSIQWQAPLGTYSDLAPWPVGILLGKTGTPNLGGSIVTASGLVFIGAAMDNYLRAFDVDTGEELWKGRLPAGGQATPMTYRLREDGKQYVVIAAGGHNDLHTTPGDYVVAFSLP